jgi:hypothetical protein
MNVCTICDLDQKSVPLGSISCEIACRGAMKASLRIVLVFRFEFMPCLAKAWVLEYGLLSKPKRVEFWTSITHELRFLPACQVESRLRPGRSQRGLVGDAPVV